MRRRQNDPWDQPWVTIAAVVGVIAVIGIAIFFFLGSGGSDGASASTGTSPTTTGSGTSTVVSGTINPTTIKDQPTVSVPAEGVFVKVMYLGGFSGEYGMAGEMLSARDSGERVYEVVNATGTVSAKFKKTDSSTKPHELSVEIWKDGRVLKFEKNASPSGEVSIDYSL